MTFYFYEEKSALGKWYGKIRFKDRPETDTIEGKRSIRNVQAIPPILSSLTPAQLQFVVRSNKGSLT